MDGRGLFTKNRKRWFSGIPPLPFLPFLPPPSPYLPFPSKTNKKGSRAQDAYGTTEFPGISIDGEIVPSVQIRLEDVPGRYLADDKPYPRGQILVRHKMGKEFLSGYFLCPDEMKESFTEDGWFDFSFYLFNNVCIWKREIFGSALVFFFLINPLHLLSIVFRYKTGDIGELNHDKPAEDGRPTLKIIDRLKNLLEIYVEFVFSLLFFLSFFSPSSFPSLTLLPPFYL